MASSLSNGLSERNNLRYKFTYGRESMKKISFLVVALLAFAAVSRADESKPGGSTAPSKDALQGNPAPAAESAALSFEIKIGTAVENHEVTGEADKFPADTAQLIGWSKVTGATEPLQISHVWKRNGEQAASVPLMVKSSPYRTYSRKTVTDMPGKWSLEVQDTNGKVLATKEVQVGE